MIKCLTIISRMILLLMMMAMILSAVACEGTPENTSDEEQKIKISEPIIEEQIVEEEPIIEKPYEVDPAIQDRIDQAKKKAEEIEKIAKQMAYIFNNDDYWEYYEIYDDFYTLCLNACELNDSYDFDTNKSILYSNQDDVMNSWNRARTLSKIPEFIKNEIEINIILSIYGYNNLLFDYTIFFHDESSIKFIKELQNKFQEKLQILREMDYNNFVFNQVFTEDFFDFYGVNSYGVDEKYKYFIETYPNVNEVAFQILCNTYINYYIYGIKIKLEKLGLIYFSGEIKFDKLQEIRENMSSFVNKEINELNN